MERVVTDEIMRCSSSSSTMAPITAPATQMSTTTTTSSSSSTNQTRPTSTIKKYKKVAEARRTKLAKHPLFCSSYSVGPNESVGDCYSCRLFAENGTCLYCIKRGTLICGSWDDYKHACISYNGTCPTCLREY